MKTFINSILFCLLLIIPFSLFSNNIQVSNVLLTDLDSEEGSVLVQFDLSWENSWRTNDLNGDGVTNWDAAWIFVKYQVDDGDWNHAELDFDGHNTGTGTPALIRAGVVNENEAFNSTTNPVVGVFIFRSIEGSGTFGISNVSLRWNYRQNGISNNARVNVRVFAIETVLVPRGQFYVGSGGTEPASLTQANIISGNTAPFLITSTPPTIQGNNESSSSSNLSARSNIDLTGTSTAELATYFPTGYGGFYCMKYSISQQQYVDFLNTLTQAQADERKYTGSSSRYAITGDIVGGYATSNPYVACNFLSWADGIYYTAWAGLRPMTELEYEKACRGTASPVANEFAWGASTINGNFYSLSNQGNSNETISTNYNYSTGNAIHSTSVQQDNKGPVRNGIFATSNSTRVQAGASYYGIMDLSGNVWERAVTIGNADGRNYSGIHGDGKYNFDFDSNNWPGISAVGSGYRGGTWDNEYSVARVSNRLSAAGTNPDRYMTNGFRAVRSLPTETGTVTINEVDYNTVMIGNQTWMAENLKVTKYQNGESIPVIYFSSSQNTQWSNTYTGAMAYYKYNEYGHLYNWYAVTDPRGIAPAGWRVPTDDDWKELEMFLGMSQIDANKTGQYRGTTEGQKLKSTTSWSNLNGTDEVGFNARPEGVRGETGNYGSEYLDAFFWTSTEYDLYNAWYRRLNSNLNTVMRDNHYLNNFGKKIGASVRLIKE